MNRQMLKIEIKLDEVSKEKEKKNVGIGKFLELTKDSSKKLWTSHQVGEDDPTESVTAVGISRTVTFIGKGLLMPDEYTKKVDDPNDPFEDLLVNKFEEAGFIRVQKIRDE